MRKNEERDEAIYAHFLAGISKAEIARVENISATRVGQIIRRKALYIALHTGNTIIKVTNGKDNHD